MKYASRGLSPRLTSLRTLINIKGMRLTKAERANAEWLYTRLKSSKRTLRIYQNVRRRCRGPIGDGSNSLIFQLEGACYRIFVYLPKSKRYPAQIYMYRNTISRGLVPMEPFMALTLEALFYAGVRRA